MCPGFYSEYRDMMEFGLVNVSPITFQSRNVGNTRIYGAEVTLAGEGKNWKIPNRLNGWLQLYCSKVY